MAKKLKQMTAKEVVAYMKFWATTIPSNLSAKDKRDIRRVLGKISATCNEIIEQHACKA